MNMKKTQYTTDMVKTVCAEARTAMNLKKRKGLRCRPRNRGRRRARRRTWTPIELAPRRHADSWPERRRIVCSYNGGAAKLQLKRENKSGNGWKFGKLGRMTANEFQELVPVALELIDTHGVK